MTSLSRTLAAGRLSILFVDDDPFRHEVFARQARGHRVDHSWFVDDALERLNTWRYDLVCLDHDLATEDFERDGRELARHIATMPLAARPLAVLVHSRNFFRAGDMERTLRRRYQPGPTLLRAEFGTFAVLAPGPSLAGEPDLRRWVRTLVQPDTSVLSELLDQEPAAGAVLGGR